MSRIYHGRYQRQLYFHFHQLTSPAGVSESRDRICFACVYFFVGNFCIFSIYLTKSWRDETCCHIDGRPLHCSRSLFFPFFLTTWYIDGQPHRRQCASVRTSRRNSPKWCSTRKKTRLIIKHIFTEAHRRYHSHGVQSTILKHLNWYRRTDVYPPAIMFISILSRYTQYMSQSICANLGIKDRTEIYRSENAFKVGRFCQVAPKYYGGIFCPLR